MAYLASMASIHITGGRSLRPVKNRDGSFAKGVSLDQNFPPTSDAP